jgi:hypothetical protein
LAILAACGDNGGTHPDAPSSADAYAFPDARVCAPGEVETELVAVGVTDGVHTVTLDGDGTRCEQLTRAIMDPAVFPAELAPMLGTDFHTQCGQFSQFDEVDFLGDGIGGVPFVFGPAWEVFVQLEDLKIDFWSGSYIPPAPLPAPACLSPTAIHLGLNGTVLPYSPHDTCTITGGPGSYSIAIGDTIDVADTDFYYLEFGVAATLYRLRAVDAFLLPSHIRSDMRGSELDCCAGGVPIDCMGERLFVDTSTGAVKFTQGLCTPTCTPE